MTRSTKKSVVLACGLLAIVAGAAALYFVHAHVQAVRNSCMDNLRRIQVARDQWASLHSRPDAVPTWEDLRAYFPKDLPNSPVWKDGLPICPEGGTYTIGKPGQFPTCTIQYHTLDPAQMR